MNDLSPHLSSGLISEIHAHLMDPDRIPFAIMAVLVVSIIGLFSGPLAGYAGPLTWWITDKTIGPLGDRLDKRQRTRPDLMLRGFIVVSIAILLALLLSGFLESLASEPSFYGLLEVLILSLMLSAGSLWHALYLLYQALEKKTVGKGAYLSIARTAHKNLSIADDFGITRTGMGLSARMFDKGLVSPVLWYLIGGIPAALIYSVISALAWRFGKDGFTKGFGTIALGLERLMGYVPSLYAALLLTLASLFTPTAKLHKGVAAWFGHKNRAPYKQGGFPLSALAWSLHVSLGGASQDLSGSAIQGAWVGPDGATAKVEHQHLKRAIYISLMAHLLFVASLGGAYVWSGQF
jgi:adenosylcobinamide-phosphate synthase